MLTLAAAKPAAYTSHTMHSTNFADTKLQNHQEHQLLMPKYLLTAPTGKRALTQRKK